MHIMSRTGAAGWKHWVAETLVLRTNQSGKGLGVQHLHSASIHFTSTRCRAVFIHKISFLRRKEYFFKLKTVAVHSVIFMEKYMCLNQHSGKPVVFLKSFSSIIHLRILIFLRKHVCFL